MKQSERFIYGNFYPASSATGFWKDKESKQAFGVCDGGPVFWGIVFRVSTQDNRGDSVQWARIAW